MQRRKFIGAVAAAGFLLACSKVDAQAKSERGNELAELIAAMAAAIPEFKVEYLPKTPSPKNADIWFDWMYEALQDKFIAYVEWKEWDSYIDDSVNQLIPIVKAQALIDTDKLDVWLDGFYKKIEANDTIKNEQAKAAQEVWNGVKNEVPEPYKNALDFETLMKNGIAANKNLNDAMLLGINAQLQPKGLRMIDVGMNENPYLLCVSLDESALERLITAFSAYEVDVYVAEPSNAFAKKP